MSINISENPAAQTYVQNKKYYPYNLFIYNYYTLKYNIEKIAKGDKNRMRELLNEKVDVIIILNDNIEKPLQKEGSDYDMKLSTTILKVDDEGFKSITFKNGDKYSATISSILEDILNPAKISRVVVNSDDATMFKSSQHVAERNSLLQSFNIADAISHIDTYATNNLFIKLLNMHSHTDIFENFHHMEDFSTLCSYDTRMNLAKKTNVLFKYMKENDSKYKFIDDYTLISSRNVMDYSTSCEDTQRAVKAKITDVELEEMMRRK